MRSGTGVVTAEVFPWSARISVEYNRSLVTPELLEHLLNLAGFHYGIGKWRPGQGGSFGQFRVVRSK